MARLNPYNVMTEHELTMVSRALGYMQLVYANLFKAATAGSTLSKSYAAWFLASKMAGRKVYYHEPVSAFAMDEKEMLYRCIGYLEDGFILPDGTPTPEFAASWHVDSQRKPITLIIDNEDYEPTQQTTRPQLRLVKP